MICEDCKREMKTAAYQEFIAKKQLDPRITMEQFLENLRTNEREIESESQSLYMNIFANLAILLPLMERYRRENPEAREEFPYRGLYGNQYIYAHHRAPIMHRFCSVCGKENKDAVVLQEENGPFQF